MAAAIRRSSVGLLLARALFVGGLTLLPVSPAGAQDSLGTTKARLRQMGILKNPRIMGLHRPQTAQSSQAQVADEEDSLYLRFPPPGTGQAPLPPPTVHRSPPVVVSRTQRNLLWVLAPVGDETEIYAADTSGRDLGTWRLDPALYTEWTALALGRCDRKTCLYVGDLGDSLRRRGTVQVYRFEEPLLAFDRIPRTYGITGVQKLVVGYPDGAHDARALVVLADGSVLIVTSGFDGKSRLYSVPADAWTRGGTRVDARSAGTVAVNTQRFGALTGITRTATGGFVARSATRLTFLTRAESGMVPDPSRRPCELPAGNQSGLGVDWMDNRRFIISMVQGFNPTPTLSVVECAEP
jgi:hypothetical protein